MAAKCTPWRKGGISSEFSRCGRFGLQVSTSSRGQHAYAVTYEGRTMEVGLAKSRAAAKRAARNKVSSSGQLGFPLYWLIERAHHHARPHRRHRRR